MKSKSAADERRLLYLYGISAKVPKLRTTGSVDGTSAVEHLPESGLVAWFSRVPAQDYGEKLAANMENLEWLAGASVRHQRVVSQLAEAVTLLPARFGTVFSTELSLAKHIRERHDELLKTLGRIEGTEEWGVKLFLQASPASAWITADSGRDYLRAKAAVRQEQQRNQLDPEVVEFARELQAIAVESAPAGKVSSGQSNLEWQASFLVRKRDHAKWNRVLKEYAARWAARREIQCTGPWPPYSFV